MVLKPSGSQLFTNPLRRGCQRQQPGRISSIRGARSIEFIGLPGTGKSWYCRSLAKSLRQRETKELPKHFPPVDTENRLKVLFCKLLRAACFSFRHPQKTLDLAWLIRNSGQSSVRNAIAKTINLLAELGKSAWHENAVIICEQGVLQAIWSLALHSRQFDLGGILQIADPYLPWIVLLVETEWDRIHDHLDNRTTGRSRLDRMPRQQRDAAFRKGERIFWEIIEEWKKLQADNLYLRVQSEDPDSLENLLTAIHEPLKRRRRNSMSYETALISQQRAERVIP